MHTHKGPKLKDQGHQSYDPLHIISTTIETQLGVEIQMKKTNFGWGSHDS